MDRMAVFLIPLCLALIIIHFYKKAGWKREKKKYRRMVRYYKVKSEQLQARIDSKKNYTRNIVDFRLDEAKKRVIEANKRANDAEKRYQNLREIRTALNSAQKAAN